MNVTFLSCIQALRFDTKSEILQKDLLRDFVSQFFLRIPGRQFYDDPFVSHEAFK